MLTTLFCLVLGICLWPALEYGLHAGLGHLYLRGKTEFSRQHLRHHGQKDWFAPNRQKALAAIPVLVVLFAVAGSIAGWANGAALTAAFALMYGSYEVIHRRAHTHPPTGPYSRWVRRNHFSHHFQNPRKNHGVTTPFFDYVMRTHVAPGKVVVPERFAMCWLVDPKTGDIWNSFADDYEIRRASRSELVRQKDTQRDLASAYEGEAPVF